MKKAKLQWKYVCPKCKRIFIRGFFQYLKAMHFGSIRYFKCPQCKKRSWCRVKK